MVFTTMNVADTKHPVMKLMYDGAEVAEWRLVLEQDAPDLGPAEQMLERVAFDPVSQALFTDMMMKFFMNASLVIKNLMMKLLPLIRKTMKMMLMMTMIKY